MNDDDLGGLVFGCAFAALVVAMLLLVGFGMGYLVWGL